MIVECIVGLTIIKVNCKIRKINYNKIFDTILVSIPSAFIGGRVYHVVTNIDLYKNNIIDVFNINHGGIDHAGIILGILMGSYVYRKVKKESFFEFIIVTIPVVFLIKIFNDNILLK